MDSNAEMEEKIKEHQSTFGKWVQYSPISICLFGVFRPTREFLSHFEMSLLPVKGCKF